MDIDITNDPTASLVEADQPNATIVPSADGKYRRIVFEPDERERVKAFLKLSIATTKESYVGIWEKRDRNKKAYEALSDKGENITLPWCRQMTNQQHAWLINQVFSRDPFVSCQALGDSQIQIVVRNPDTGVAEIKSVTSTQEADGIAKLLNYKWTFRLPMRKVLTDVAMEGLQDGTVPALVKIVVDDSEVTIADRKAPYIAKDDTGAPKKNANGQNIQIIDSPEFRTVRRGEPVQIVCVPGEKLLRPLSALDLQSSPWIAMEMEQTVSQRRQLLRNGKYDFAQVEEPTKEQIDAVLYGLQNPDEMPSKRASKAAREVNKQKEISPTDTLVTYETYFRWPILEASETGESSIVWTECVGDFDERSGELLCCWVLPSWNGKRPFEDWFAHQRPNSYSGTCPVEDVAPFQRYASNLFHLQVQNMVMRNVSVFFVRKGSASASFLKGKKLKPGMVVEFDEPSDVESKPLGTPIDSIANEITFLKSGAQEMSLVTQYDNATANLSRVTAGAFQQQQDLAKMQPEMIYESFAEFISRVALSYVQHLIQYAPEQKLPSFDSENDAIIDNVLHMPRQMVTDADFAFTTTATARDESKEVLFQRDQQVATQVQNANNFLMSSLGVIMAPNVPPPFIKLGLKAIARSEAALKAQIEHTRHDVSTFTIDPKEIMGALLDMMNLQAQMQQAAQQQQAQTGGQGGQLPDAGPGGAIPAGQSGPEGLPQVPPQLGQQGAGAMGPQ